MLRILLRILLLLCLMASTAFAGVTGKIAGKVTDAESDSPLVGVNIIILGTTLGAATNENGDYFIINIPPGTYTVQYSYLGYAKVEVQQVVVKIDQTTRLNVTLESSALEMETVVITAERTMIQRDETGRQQSITQQDIVEMPVTDFTEAITLESGMMEVSATGDMMGGRHERGLTEFHLRGGRSGEVLFMVDGMPVQNVVYGGSATNINVDALSELVVISSGYNAEYSNAMSGIVNLITREGSNNYDGTVEFSSGELGSEYDDYHDAHRVRYSVGGPLMKDRVYFFLSGENRFNRQSVYEYDNIFYDPSVGGKQYDSEGREISQRDTEAYAGMQAFGFEKYNNILGKFTIKFSPAIKLSLSGEFSTRDLQNFNDAWRYSIDGRRIVYWDNQRFAFDFTHTINSSTFYSIKGSWFKYQQNMHPLRGGQGLIEGFRYPENPLGYQQVTYQSGYIADGSSDNIFSEEATDSKILRMDLTSQFTQHHQAKIGAELKRININMYENRAPYLPLPHNYRDIYDYTPTEIGLYVQDKIEYENFVINLGLRLDYNSLPDDIKFWSDPSDVASEVVSAGSNTMLSPRIGISYPITQTSIFHFNYGQFVQQPVYRNMLVLTTTDQAQLNDAISQQSIYALGNPTLDFETTVSYEAGFKFQVADDWAMDLTAWIKDSNNLVSAHQIPAFYDSDVANPYKYGVLMNSDYGSVKGIDMSLQKRFSNNYSLSMNYTFSKARGNESGQYFSIYPQEIISGGASYRREITLRWDRSHQITTNFHYKIPENSGPSIGNFKPLGDFGINLIYKGLSGLPYTPMTPYPLMLEPNTTKRPWTHQFDARIYKDFRCFGNQYLTFFFDVRNLLDTDNAIYVWPKTGTANDPGPASTGFSDTYDRPDYFGLMRRINFGIKYTF